MENLVKQVVFISKTRQDALKAEAEQLGITVSELVRRVLDGREAAKTKRAGKG